MSACKVLYRMLEETENPQLYVGRDCCCLEKCISL